MTKPRLWLALLLLLAAASVPWLDATRPLQSLVLYTFLFITLSVAWNIIGGYAGQTSFGHAAFYGLGAYTTGVLAVGKLGALQLPALSTLPLAGAAAALYAVLIGYPTLRLRGPYFSIATIGVGEATRILALNMPALTGGASGLTLPQPQTPAAVQLYALQMFYLLLAWMVAVLVVSAWIKNSRFGLGLLAVNMDTDAAETVGVNTARAKILAFALSAFLVGVSGSLYAQIIFFIDPGAVFGFNNSIAMVLMATIGGIGTLWGPVLGAIVYYVVDNRLSTTELDLLGQRIALTNFTLLLYGTLLVAIILAEPRGLVGIGARVIKRLARRGPSVPQLLKQPAPPPEGKGEVTERAP
ncbi:MAG TPA: branched-chain amino acid ABC transporter permease [Chloroflexota bacterium]|nr:branched-chain amino acid ABC transporter permease [Chloroflexota bacterium]